MMSAASAILMNRVHTGPWVLLPRAASPVRRARAAFDGSSARVRLYYLLDGRGDRLGVIAAPEGRPTLGPAAPTVYLRRV